MRRHKSLETHNYWPGYVDALTNIALNLLFLVAIFVIGVAVLGVISAGRVDPKQKNQTDQAPFNITEQLKNVIRKIIVHAPSDKKPISSSKVLLETLESDETQSVLFRFKFEKNSFLINEQQQKDFAHQFATTISNSNTKFDLFALLITDDTLHIRGSMARLLALRNILLQSGVSADRINVRIIPNDSSLKAEHSIYLKIIEN